jgi:hypothetical protein
LITAFALAQCDIQGRKQDYLRKALVAINVRDLFRSPEGENFGLLAASIEVTLPAGKGSFWNLAQEFNTEMRNLLSNQRVLNYIAPLDYLDLTLLDAVYFVAYGTLKNKTVLSLKRRILTPTDRPKRSMDTTNLGIFNIGKNPNLKTIFFVPILSTNYEKTIGIVTIGGEMNISIMHDRSRISSDTIDDFKQRIISYVKGAVEG